MNNYEFYVDDEGICEFPLNVLQDFHIREELRAYEESGRKKGYGNVGVGLRIKHKLNYEKFEKCVEKVINENDQLRAVCVKCGDIYKQKIIKSIDFKLNVIDAEGKTAEDKMNFIMEYSNAEIAKSIDFLNGVGYRMMLFRIADDDNVFMVIAHHWIGDGTSLGMLFNSVLAYYVYPETEVSDKPSFIDYVKEQEDFCKSPKGIQQKKYWEDELKDYEPFNFDSIDFGEESNGIDRNFIIPQETVNKLSEKYKVSNFIVFHMALHVAVSLFTGKYDTVIGATSANRSLKYRNTMGFFARPILLRLIINDDNDKLLDLLEMTAKKFSKGLTNIKLSDRIDLVQFTNPYQNYVPAGGKIYEDIDVERITLSAERMIRTGIFSVIEKSDNLIVVVSSSGKIATDKFVNSIKDYINCVFESLNTDPDATVDDVKKLYESRKDA